MFVITISAIKIIFGGSKNCGGRVNVFYIPSLVVNDGDGGRKDVLYCNPNDGLYEVTIGMNLIRENAVAAAVALDASNNLDATANLSLPTIRKDDLCWTD